MPTTFLPNFDFEHQLVTGRNYQSSEQLKRINSELMWSFLCVMKEGDYLLTEAKLDSDFLKTLKEQGLNAPKCIQSFKSTHGEISPWGWSDTVKAMNQNKTSHPSIDSVRNINSRLYSFQLETELKIGLIQSLLIEDISLLENHLKNEFRNNEPWVIKSEFAMSGRERITGTDNKLSEPQMNWIQKRIRVGQKLFLEPWVHATSEAGIQFTIPNKGEPILEGLVPLISTKKGGYQGSLISHSPKNPQLWKKAIEWGFQIAERIQCEGYWGPLGIDAMLYKKHDQECLLRPVMDINGRLTMGRCALEFRKLLNENEVGYLFHLSRKNPNSKQFRNRLKSYNESLTLQERTIQLSPWSTDEIPNQIMMFLIIAEDQERVLSIADELMELEQIQEI